MQLDSTNKRILVVADPHQDMATLNKIVKYEDADITVCLGDYFDSFIYNTKEAVEATCEFLLNHADKDNFVTLAGNHDLPYFHDNSYTAACSGFGMDKKRLIWEFMHTSYNKVKAKFKWYVWIDDFLCTHAGLHPRFLPVNQKLDKPSLTRLLDEQVEYAEYGLKTGGSHWFYRAGEGRGGNQKVGGIVWLDYDTEFEPIDGLKQLVGHSSHPTILNHYTDGNLDFTQCDNLDLDCHLSQYLIIHNQKLQIKKTIDI